MPWPIRQACIHAHQINDNQLNPTRPAGNHANIIATFNCNIRQGNTFARIYLSDNGFELSRISQFYIDVSGNDVQKCVTVFAGWASILCRNEIQESPMIRFVFAAALIVTFATSVQSATPVVTSTTTNVMRCPATICDAGIFHPMVRR